jgi:hypothetical protein
MLLKFQWFTAEFPTTRNRDFSGAYQGKIAAIQGIQLPMVSVGNRSVCFWRDLIVTKSDCANRWVLQRRLLMAISRKKARGRIKRVSWTKEHVRDLKAHSKSKTPVAKISKAMKRTSGAIRQKALSLGISIGHRR